MALTHSISEFADTTLSLIQSRFRLLGLELQELASRGMVALVLALSAAVCLTLGGLTLIAAIVLQAPPGERVMTLWWILGIVLALGVVCGVLCTLLVRSTRHAFNATIDELQRDRAVLRSIRPGSSHDA